MYFAITNTITCTLITMYLSLLYTIYCLLLLLLLLPALYLVLFQLTITIANTPFSKALWLLVN